MVATQMSLTLFSSDEIYLAISDDIPSCQQIALSANQDCTFKRVFPFKKRRRTKLRYFLDALFGNNVCNFDKTIRIDEIYSFNFDLYSHFIFAYFYKKNKNIKTFRFEEGVLSYFVDFDKSRFLTHLYRIRRFLKKKNMRDICESFYCFRPSLYSGNLRPILIESPVNNIGLFVERMMNLFVTNMDDIILPSGVIYLSSIYNVDGNGKIDETELVNTIKCSIEPKKLFVKPHPRDSILVSSSFVLKSSFPIECLALFNYKNTDTLYISSFSGSLLNLVSLFGNHFKCIYTTNLCDCTKNTVASYFASLINKLCMDDVFKDNIFLAQKVGDLKP